MESKEQLILIRKIIECLKDARELKLNIKKSLIYSYSIQIILQNKGYRGAAEGLDLWL